MKKDKLDGTVMFAYDSNMHNMELFDELVGWHAFNLLRYTMNSAIYIDDRARVLPRNLEWSGFVLNSRLFWKDVDDKPSWIKNLTFFCKFILNKILF